MSMRRVLAALVTVLCALLIVPIAVVVVLAFGDQTFLHFPPPGFSLRWFAAFFGSARWRMALWSSVEIGLIASLLSTVCGFFGAYALVRRQFIGKVAVLSMILLPMIVPTVITSVAMYFLSASLHLVGDRIWVGICHAVIALPIVMLILLSALQGVEPNLERAALSLGASQARVLWKVVVPIAGPGIASAALFAFLTSFDELIIALFLTKADSQTLPCGSGIACNWMWSPWWRRSVLS
jgi:putative spermidine/putrescine transport system permease protein